jgi:hypothetical protein
MEISNQLHPSQKQDEIIVVKLWEIYLLYHPASLYKVLTDFSLDKCPQDDQQLSGRVIFRFSKTAWEENVRDILYEHRIPVVIQSNRLQAVQVKGRQPILR